MNELSVALRLADALKNNTSIVGADQIAAELRRLHAESENYKRIMRDGQESFRLATEGNRNLHAVNAGLLEAQRACVEYGSMTGDDWVADKAQAALKATGAPERCCLHDSDCAVHNMPAFPAGPCDCSLKPVAWVSVTKGDVSKALLYFDENEEIKPLGVMGGVTTRKTIASAAIKAAGGEV